MPGKIGTALKNMLRVYGRRAIYRHLEKNAQDLFDYENQEMPSEEEMRRQAAAIEAGWHQECFEEKQTDKRK